jgi:hypothetical protein
MTETWDTRSLLLPNQLEMRGMDEAKQRNILAMLDKTEYGKETAQERKERLMGEEPYGLDAYDFCQITILTKFESERWKYFNTQLHKMGLGIWSFRTYHNWVVVRRWMTCGCINICLPSQELNALNTWIY